jgi:hypothetical protein
MPTTEKTYQSILRTLSRVSVDALPQIDLYLQNFVVEKKPAKKKLIAKPVLELSPPQVVDEKEILSLWQDRPESAQEIARQIRQRNRQIT